MHCWERGCCGCRGLCRCLPPCSVEATTQLCCRTCCATLLRPTSPSALGFRQPTPPHPSFLLPSTATAPRRRVPPASTAPSSAAASAVAPPPSKRPLPGAAPPGRGRRRRVRRPRRRGPGPAAQPRWPRGVAGCACQLHAGYCNLPPTNRHSDSLRAELRGTGWRWVQLS